MRYIHRSRTGVTLACGALALMGAGPATQGQLFGEFVLVEDDVTLTGNVDGVIQPVTADVYEFRVTNQTTADVRSFSFDFAGDFLNGFNTTAWATPSLPFTPEIRVTETFLAGNGTTPIMLGDLVVDTDRRLTVAAAAVAHPADPWVASGATATLATFTTPYDAPPLNYSDNVSLVRGVLSVDYEVGVGDFVRTWTTTSDVLPMGSYLPGVYPNRSPASEFGEILTLPQDQTFSFLQNVTPGTQVNVAPGGGVRSIWLGGDASAGEGIAEINIGQAGPATGRQDHVPPEPSRRGREMHCRGRAY